MAFNLSVAVVAVVVVLRGKVTDTSGRITEADTLGGPKGDAFEETDATADADVEGEMTCLEEDVSVFLIKGDV